MSFSRPKRNEERERTEKCVMVKEDGKRYESMKRDDEDDCRGLCEARERDREKGRRGLGWERERRERWGNVFRVRATAYGFIRVGPVYMHGSLKARR